MYNFLAPRKLRGLLERHLRGDEISEQLLSLHQKRTAFALHEMT